MAELALMLAMCVVAGLTRGKPGLAWWHPSRIAVVTLCFVVQLGVMLAAAAYLRMPLALNMAAGLAAGVFLLAASISGQKQADRTPTGQ